MLAFPLGPVELFEQVVTPTAEDRNGDEAAAQGVDDADNKANDNGNRGSHDEGKKASGQDRPDKGNEGQQPAEHHPAYWHQNNAKEKRQ